MAFAKTSFIASAVAATVLASAVPAAAQADYGYYNYNRPVVIYFTRHAEKKTSTVTLGDASTTYEYVWAGDDATATAGGVDDDQANNDTGNSKGDNLDEVCGESKCAEELNALGLKRAELLANWFKRRGITRRVDAVYSSHKRRTFQTVEQIALDAGTSVVQLPLGASELQPESTSPSECPTLAAIRAAAPGDTLVVAGHSGTLYDIMGDGNSTCAGLGLLTDDDASSDRFPKVEEGSKKGKVRDFGDIWKVVYYPAGDYARFAYRVNLQPKRLGVENFAY